MIFCNTCYNCNDYYIFYKSNLQTTGGLVVSSLGGYNHNMSKETVHQTHPDVIKRLKRAAGHLHKVIGMLEGKRPCLEIAQQLRAVECAIGAAKKLFIHDHIDHCVEHAAVSSEKDARTTLDEFKQITKYL